MVSRLQKPKARCKTCAEPVYQISCDRCLGPLDEILCDECTRPAEHLFCRYMRFGRGHNNDFPDWRRHPHGLNFQNRRTLHDAKHSVRLCGSCENELLLNMVGKESGPSRSFSGIYPQNPAPRPDVNQIGGGHGASTAQSLYPMEPQPSVVTTGDLPPLYRSDWWKSGNEKKTANSEHFKLDAKDSGDGQDFRTGEPSTSQARQSGGSECHQNPQEGPENANSEHAGAQQTRIRVVNPPSRVWVVKQFRPTTLELLDITGLSLAEGRIAVNECEGVPHEAVDDEHSKTEAHVVKLGLRGGGAGAGKRHKKGQGGRGGPPGKKGDDWNQQRPRQQQQQTPASSAARTTWRVAREMKPGSENLVAADLRAMVVLIWAVVERLPSGRKDITESAPNPT